MALTVPLDDRRRLALPQRLLSPQAMGALVPWLQWPQWLAQQQAEARRALDCEIASLRDQRLQALQAEIDDARRSFQAECAALRWAASVQFDTLAREVATELAQQLADALSTVWARSPQLRQAIHQSLLSQALQCLGDRAHGGGLYVHAAAADHDVLEQALQQCGVDPARHAQLVVDDALRPGVCMVRCDTQLFECDVSHWLAEVQRQLQRNALQLLWPPAAADAARGPESSAEPQAEWLVPAEDSAAVADADDLDFTDDDDNDETAADFDGFGAPAGEEFADATADGVAVGHGDGWLTMQEQDDSLLETLGAAAASEPVDFNLVQRRPRPPSPSAAARRSGRPAQHDLPRNRPSGRQDP